MGLSHTAYIDENMKLVINPPEQIVDRIITSNRALGMFMAETCARRMDKYVPMDTGMLAQNFITEPYKVTYTVPYAKRMFYGEDFNFSQEKHRLATARWDRACGIAEGKDIAKDVENYIRRM